MLRASQQDTRSDAVFGRVSVLSSPGDQPFAFSLFSKHWPPFTSVYHMENCVVMQSKKGLHYPFVLNVYSVLYCSLISFFFLFFFLNALVARRLTLDRILSFHHCKLISWHVHLPEFWLKSINLIQKNFILKKPSILSF